MAFTDAFTRYTWLYFLCQKFDVASVFPHLLKQAERALGVKLVTLQTDRGREFQALKSYLATEGIFHKLTCPYTLEQNGLVERKHRHVMENGLSMLAHAGMPLHYWYEAFSNAVFLINRLPPKL